MAGVETRERHGPWECDGTVLITFIVWRENNAMLSFIN